MLSRKNLSRQGSRRTKKAFDDMSNTETHNRKKSKVSKHDRSSTS